MKFTTFSTFSTKTAAMAFIIAAGITHSMAAEVDCATPGSFKGKATEEYDGSADTCIGDNTLVLTNPKMADKILKLYCTKKTAQMSGSKWKTKNAANLPQEKCDMLGATLDCANALKACSKRPEDKREECAEKIRPKNKDCKVEGVYDAVIEAVKTQTLIFAPAG